MHSAVLVVLMMVTIVTVNVLMFDFIVSRWANFSDFNAATQCHACERMVAVEYDFVAFNVCDGEELNVIF
jgi:hypothetical protein